jgi:hypothetical protein
MAQAMDLARAAGLWRIDDRWRDAYPSLEALPVIMENDRD